MHLKDGLQHQGMTNHPRITEIHSHFGKKGGIMKTKRFIPALVLSFIGLFLISTSSTAVLAMPGDTEQVQLAQKEPPPPPKTVSPKDAGSEGPFPALNCPHCGKQINSRWGKGAKARPRLGAGQARQERMVQGRRGMQGRHGMHERRAGHSAHPGKMGHRGAGRPARSGQLAMLLRHADILGLTKDQQTKLKDLKFTAEKERIDLKAAMQKEQLELKQLMKEEDLNARSIKSQLEAVAQARTNLKFRGISLRIEARNVLTAEQRELIKEKLQGFKGGNRMGHCGQDCIGMVCPPGCCPNSDFSPDPDVAPEREMHLEEE
jgi:Spy/CpxP family protein refolding chaperone